MRERDTEKKNKKEKKADRSSFAHEDAGLFCGDVQLFCGDTGLFSGDIAPFCGDTGLVYADVGLFCGDTCDTTCRIHVTPSMCTQ